jgi:hypothetical protein
MKFDDGMAAKALAAMLERGILVDVRPGWFKLGDPLPSSSAPTASAAPPEEMTAEGTRGEGDGI